MNLFNKSHSPFLSVNHPKRNLDLLSAVRLTVSVNDFQSLDYMRDTVFVLFQHTIKVSFEFDKVFCLLLMGEGGVSCHF